MNVVKKIYKSIYRFDVVDTIKGGKDVFVLDREEKTVRRVSEMDALSFIGATSIEDDVNRFAFWIEEEAEITKNEKEKAENE